MSGQLWPDIFSNSQHDEITHRNIVYIKETPDETSISNAGVLHDPSEGGYHRYQNHAFIQRGCIMKHRILPLHTIVFLFIPFVMMGQDARPKITSQEDLPRHTYSIEGSADKLLLDTEAFARFAATVRSDIEKDLSTYDIQDRSTLRGLHETLLTLELLDEDDDAALRRLGVLKSLMEKPSEKLMSGLTSKAIIKARREMRENGRPLREGFRKHFQSAVNELPWNIVQDDIEQLKGSNEMFSKNLALGIIQSTIQPAVDKSGALSGGLAPQLIGMRYYLDVIFPLKDEIIPVLQSYVDAHRVDKADIWKNRDVDLSGMTDLHPVVVAIWDTGVDPSVFPGLLFINPGEKPNGKDDDGNGFVDDVHGIAYSLYMEKNPDMLYPIDAALRPKMSKLYSQIKGLMDIQAGIESPEASLVKQKMSGMKPEDVRLFIEELGLFGIYTHGTHVAGIASRGNPAIRLMIARLCFDYKAVPDPWTYSMEGGKAWAAGIHETVEYFKKHGVRAVNMSWGLTPKEYESGLEMNGIGENAEDRSRMAREAYMLVRNALIESMTSTPNILFVVAAGNSDSDTGFDENVPASFDLPNVLTAAAVDQAGMETSFTSFGKSVDLCANGFEVESYLPGGETAKYSGTSMAAPNVLNLAAKLWAVNPDLSVADVVALIKDGANRNEDDRLILINPKKTMEALKTRASN